MASLTTTSDPMISVSQSTEVTPPQTKLNPQTPVRTEQLPPNPYPSDSPGYILFQLAHTGTYTPSSQKTILDELLNLAQSGRS